MHFLINLASTLLLLTLGTLFLLFPWLPSLPTTYLVPLGILLLALGLAHATILIRISRRRYVHLGTGAHPITLSETLIHDYLESYWKELFPEAEIPYQLVMKKGNLQVIADLPHVPPEEENSLLKRIEGDLIDLFRGILGYPGRLDVAIRFQTAKR